MSRRRFRKVLLHIPRFKVVGNQNTIGTVYGELPAIVFAGLLFPGLGIDKGDLGAIIERGPLLLILLENFTLWSCIRVSVGLFLFLLLPLLFVLLLEGFLGPLEVHIVTLAFEDAVYKLVARCLCCLGIATAHG